jgi:signal transduction histidine kinase
LLALSPGDRAAAGDVLVEGTVTWVIPGRRAVALADDSGAIWINCFSRKTGAESWAAVRDHVRLGTVLRVVGGLDPGAYAPHIQAERIEIVRQADVPPAQLADLGRLFSGVDNAARVEIEGIVQQVPAAVEGDLWVAKVWCASREIPVQLPKTLWPEAPRSLIDAEVRVTGVTGAIRNTRGEFLGPSLLVARTEDVAVVRPPPDDPFSAPEVDLEALGTFRPVPWSGHRLRTTGVVTFASPQGFLFVQKGLTGVRVATVSTAQAVVGDRVEVAGFLDMSRRVAGLAEATIRVVFGDQKTEPLDITPDEIVRVNDEARRRASIARPGNYDGCLVRFEATVIEAKQRGPGTDLVVSNRESLLTAHMDDSRGLDVASLATGSVVRLTGIMQLDAVGNEPFDAEASSRPADRLSLLLRSPRDVVLVLPPSWWTPRRLAALLASVAAVLVGTIAWLVLLRQQVRKQASEMAEAMRSQNEATIEFETALRERNRLAANLHDTVLQTVTGIGYQLQACEAEGQRSGVFERDRLVVAHRMVDHAIQQLRGTVWALHALPAGDEPLPASIETVVARLREGHETSIRCHTEGLESPVSETVVATLLLVVQEAVTNALRHAAASTIDVTVRYGTDDTVTVTVSDNGRGFRYGEQPGSMQGHFGIDGMHDRMQGIDGECRISSEPGRGTTVTAVAPQATEDDLPDRTGAEPVGHG